jgi:TPR repeat protein
VDWAAQLEALADRGSLMSTRYLAKEYEGGRFGEVNLKEAIRWYSQAASTGSEWDQHNLGLVYLKSGQFKKAFHAFEEGADRKYIPSMRLLGRMYYKGQGVDKNVKKAMDLWSEGAAGGNILSKRELMVASMSGRFGFYEAVRGIILFPSILVTGVMEIFRQGSDSKNTR